MKLTVYNDCIVVQVGGPLKMEQLLAEWRAQWLAQPEKLAGVTANLMRDGMSRQDAEGFIFERAPSGVQWQKPLTSAEATQRVMGFDVLAQRMCEDYRIARHECSIFPVSYHGVHIAHISLPHWSRGARLSPEQLGLAVGLDTDPVMIPCDMKELLFCPCPLAPRPPRWAPYQGTCKKYSVRKRCPVEEAFDNLPPDACVDKWRSLYGEQLRLAAWDSRPADSRSGSWDFVQLGLTLLREVSQLTRAAHEQRWSSQHAQRVLALAMATHPRLGMYSAASILSAECVQHICLLARIMSEKWLVCITVRARVELQFVDCIAFHYSDGSVMHWGGPDGEEQ